MEIARDGSLLTFYVDIKDQVTLICPKCNAKRSLDATPFKDARQAMKVNCTCGEVFRCAFEFRKHFRKKVRLEGTYSIPKTKESGDVLIDNLSIEGIGFNVLNESHNIEHGSVLTMRFKLDNKQETVVERTVKVTSVRGGSVGGMFFGSARNKTVGFYLMP
jgi:hypothetical protein